MVNDTQEKFSIFFPIDIIEKADDKKDKDGLPEKLRIAGVASTPKFGKDKDGQTLLPSGFNYQPFLSKGFFNAEHAYNKTKDPSMIIGEPTNAYVKDNEFHVEGELFRDNPRAVGFYKLGQILKKSGSTRRIGYSLEGVPTSFDPKDSSIITGAVVTGMALTISPKCDGTQMLIKGGEVEYENQEGSEYLIDITDEKGERIRVDKSLNIIKGEISKSMEAGDTTGIETEDQPSNGAALKEESVQGAKKKIDWGKRLKAMKKRKGESIEDLTKAELFTFLASEYNMDIESCRNIWSLTAQIQKNLA